MELTNDQVSVAIRALIVAQAHTTNSIMNREFNALRQDLMDHMKGTHQ